MKIITFFLIAIMLVSSTSFALSESSSDKKQSISSQYKCKGKALCINGTVTKIVDGDTIYLKDYKIRLSLTNTPEKGEKGFKDATYFTKKLCPLGSIITVDQDDKQPYDKYKRVLGKVSCSGKVLNSELLYNGHANILKQYCSKSEFSGEAWAQKYGCEMKRQESKQQIQKESQIPTPAKENRCDPSYPSVCIQPPPPDLDCGDIKFSNFKVLPPDPHNFDGDNDGIGCEKSTSQPSTSVPPTTKDSDFDGIPDNVDQCDFDPETYNGFNDADGCPDEIPKESQTQPPQDSDNDTIPDTTDACPTQPETINGFEDTDGCPDVLPPKDSDGDGINDSSDQCPTESETKNSYQDFDGCPDTPPPPPIPEGNQCDPSYPDVCIPPYPPDLDCGDIPYKNFRVLPPDPHGFDRDNDGIGCEK